MLAELTNRNTNTLSAVFIVTVLVLLTSLLVLFRRHISSFLQYWNARNIVKGPPSSVHNIHVRKKQRVLRLGKNEFSIADPELIEHIYHDESFVKSSQYAAFDCAGAQTIFSIRDHVEHEKRITAVHHLFLRDEVRKREGVVKHAIARTLYAIDAGAGSGEVDILTFMRLFAIQIISEYALGATYLKDQAPNEVGKEVGLLIDDRNKSISGFGRSEAWLIRTFDAIRESCQSLYSRASELPVSDGLCEARKHLSDYCSRIAQDVHGDAEYRRSLAIIDLSPDTIEAEIADLLFSGTDSVAIALSLALWHVYAETDILGKLRDDLQYVDDEQLESRPYLNGVIQESLRLAPAVPRRLPRVVPKNEDIFYAEDKHGDGWHKILPAGSIVGISAYSLHRDQVFEDPESFIPERWMVMDARRLGRMRKCFFAFGSGARACLGQNLARSEMRHMIKSFVERFDAEIVSTRPTIVDDFSSSIQEGQVKLRIRRRSST